MVIRRSLAVLALLAITPAAFAEDEPSALGKLVFLRCQGCHAAIEKPAVVKLGPTLYDLFGRKPGSLPSYEYSAAMVAFGQDKVWNETTLTRFLHDPPNVVVETKMAFVGIKNDEEVQAVLGHIATFDPDGMAEE